jgi:hypothetical protein
MEDVVGNSILAERNPPSPQSPRIRKAENEFCESSGKSMREWTRSQQKVQAFAQPSTASMAQPQLILRTKPNKTGRCTNLAQQNKTNCTQSAKDSYYQHSFSPSCPTEVEKGFQMGGIQFPSSGKTHFGWGLQFKCWISAVNQHNNISVWNGGLLHVNISH